MFLLSSASKPVKPIKAPLSPTYHSLGTSILWVTVDSDGFLLSQGWSPLGTLNDCSGETQNTAGSPMIKQTLTIAILDMYQVLTFNSTDVVVV